MEKNLDIKIVLCKEGFTCQVHDPESGDCIEVDFPFEPTEHPEFNEWIGNEIYSWVSLMMDSMDGEE